MEWKTIDTYVVGEHPICVLVYDRIPFAARYDSDGKRWMMGGRFLDSPDFFIAIKVNPTHWAEIIPPLDIEE